MVASELVIGWWYGGGAVLVRWRCSGCVMAVHGGVAVVLQWCSA